MIYAAYNGVPMRSLKVEGFGKELTYSDDGVQPIGIHVDFQGVFAVNPGLLGRADMQRAAAGLVEPDLEGQGLVAPGLADLSAPELLVLATQRLMQPRKPLNVWAYTPRGAKVFVVQSPLKRGDGTYYDRDMRHGPTPKLIWSNFDQGAGTVLVGFAVETDIPLCLGQTGSPVVSNRWSLQVELDEDFYAVHTIDGRAVFRMDLMADRGLSADAVRSWFVHPVPLGFKRVSPVITFDSDGAGVSYRLTDVEQATDKPGVAAYGASRVEVAHQREHTGATPYAFITKE